MSNYLDIESIFSYHPPMNAETGQMHDAVGRTVKETAKFFENNLPDSPEKTLAIRKLQEAMMFANSAVAQYSKD